VTILFNPWYGCTKVSAGCLHCYAETMMADRFHKVIWGPKGTRRRTNQKLWKDVIDWNADAILKQERRKVFMASLADMFEDFKGALVNPRLLDGDRLRAFTGPRPGPMLSDALRFWRDAAFVVVDECEWLDFLVLTKRPENIPAMLSEIGKNGGYRHNVWLGTSISEQRDAVKQIPDLLKAKHLCRYVFLSVEPQLEDIDLTPWLGALDWVIVGGESDQGAGKARVFNINWARKILRQCRQHNVSCFIKQLGSNIVAPTMSDPGKHLALKDSHGGDWNEWPSDLKVRDCPENYYPNFA